MAADAIGRTVTWPVRLFRRREAIEAACVRRLLVVRTAYTGDVVMTLPILKPLKARFPAAEITFLTSRAAAPLLDRHPCVDRVIAYDPFWFYASPKADYLRFIKGMRGQVFDLVLEARGDIRDLLLLVAPLKARYKVSCGIGGGAYLLTHVVPYGGVTHRVEYHLNMARALGAEVGNVEWGFTLADEEQQAVDELLAARGLGGPFVAVHPGSRLPLKRWPLKSCRALYERIIDEVGLPIVVLGSEREREMCGHIVGQMARPPVSLAGALSLRELAGVLSKAALFVCNDSAPMHIAAAVGTPTVAVFGPSDSVETGPYGNRARVVERSMPCRATCDENRCRHRVHHECMRSITVDEVFEAVRQLLAE